MEDGASDIPLSGRRCKRGERLHVRRFDDWIAGVPVRERAQDADGVRSRYVRGPRIRASGANRYRPAPYARSICGRNRGMHQWESLAGGG